MIKVGIIGTGGIAKCLQLRLQNIGWSVVFLVRRKTYSFNGAEHARNKMAISDLLDEANPDLVFLAISTLDRGEEAKNYIGHCARKGIPVVTCEKGALAYHAEALKPFFGLIGFTATVGGGTQLIGYLHDRLIPASEERVGVYSLTQRPSEDGTKGLIPFVNRRHVEIHAVINGTLNFVFDEVARGGRTLGEACDEAMKLGYAEPGAKDALSLINGELRDVVMKTCVLFNTTLARNEFITPSKLGAIELAPRQLEELNQKAADYRFVVSFSNRTAPKKRSFFNGNFEIAVGEWHIQGGFRQTHGDTDLASWLPGGVGNAVHIIEGELGSGGKYTLSGPGAGHEATTTVMQNDAERLLKHI